MAALPFLLKERMRNELYQVYVTDCLQAICNNTANYVVPGVEDVITVGSTVNKRWYSIMNPPPEDTRSGEEIVLDVIKKAGLEVV